MIIDGSLSKSAASSGGVVESDAQNVQVPIGSTGQFEIFDQSDTGTITLEGRKNSDAYGTFTSAILFANGDDIQFRITGASAGESVTFSLREFPSNRTIVAGITIAAV